MTGNMERPLIGLALSGGGARGIAHIGVIRALEEAGIYPAMLSGTSAGAIVGALYAAGCTTDDMAYLVRDASLFKIFKVTLPLSGLTKLTYLRERLVELIPDDRFEALQKKLFVSVSNLTTGENEIISQGPLHDVVVASSSIPLVFQPVAIGDHLYVDGGLLNNLPAKPLADAGAGLVIGVNVMPTVPVEHKSLQNAFGIAVRCFDLAIQASIQPSLEYCDIFIEPQKVHAYNIFRFNRYRDLINIGYEAASQKIPEIKARIESLEIS